MLHANLGLLSLMLCVGSLRAVRYRDYSVANMPQYDYQHEGGEVSSGTDEYRDRSPDAPARLDYKYEEPLDKFEDEAIKHNEEKMWNTAYKNAKKSPTSIDDSVNIDKDSYDGLEPEVKSNGRFGKPRSPFRNKKYKSPTERRSKYNSFDHSDVSDRGEGRNYNVEREGVELPDGDDEFEELRQRFVTRRKVRRKPRDRALNRAESRKHLPLEEQDVFPRSGKRPSFEMEDVGNPHAINDQKDIVKSAKKNLDYEEYYDMRRVQNLKDRLPELLRPKTVTTSGAKRTRRYLEYWLNRRTITSVKHFESSGVPLSETITSRSATAASSTTTTSTSTMTTTLPFVNSSELSLAEKSRLSILKKAQRKESGKAGSSTTKPPVLMQVTRKMQTVVVVESEPRAVQRAREVAEETPERLQRARRLMRRKLVAGARSIHDLTDNWDEMVCDYIDVALLEADSAEMKKLDVVLIIILLIFRRFF